MYFRIYIGLAALCVVVAAGFVVLGFGIANSHGTVDFMGIKRPYALFGLIIALMLFCAVTMVRVGFRRRPKDSFFLYEHGIVLRAPGKPDVADSFTEIAEVLLFRICDRRRSSKGINCLAYRRVAGAPWRIISPWYKDYGHLMENFRRRHTAERGEILLVHLAAGESIPFATLDRRFYWFWSTYSGTPERFTKIEGITRPLKLSKYGLEQHGQAIRIESTDTVAWVGLGRLRLTSVRGETKFKAAVQNLLNADLLCFLLRHSIEWLGG
jgi:hypothetical protein